MSDDVRWFDFSDLPGDSMVGEPPPATISAEERDEFLTTFAAAGRGEPDRDDLFVYIGLDMGTSSTKVVARLPLEPGQPCIPIPAPKHCRSEGHSALWQTILWERGGTLLAYPDNGAHPLQNLKQTAMAASASHQADLQSMRPIQAATAYLGYVIGHSKGWLLVNRASVFRRRTPRWIVQVGLPARSCDQTKLANAYRRMALGGMYLSRSPIPITFADAGLALGIDEVVDASASNDRALERGVAVFPEVAAATTSFSKSNERASGLYLMVDVGAMTMDVCAFYLGQDGGSDTYSVFAADIRPLGVEARRWFRQAGRDDGEFREQISRSLRDVVVKTKKDNPNADAFGPGGDLPTFFVGGGSKSRMHREQLEKLSDWMRKYYFHDGIRELKIGVPETVDARELVRGLTNVRGALQRLIGRLTGSTTNRMRSDLGRFHDFDRLFVALGLSYPDQEIGKVSLPSEIAPIHPNPDNRTRRFEWTARNDK